MPHPLPPPLLCPPDSDKVLYTLKGMRGGGGGWGVGGCACACAKELRVCDARDVAVTDSARMGGETLTWCAKNSDVGVVVSYIY